MLAHHWLGRRVGAEMTTPEQLQAWREVGEKSWMEDLSIDMRTHPQDTYAAGYIRRCQEAEQSIKDARDIAIQECLLSCREEIEHGNATAEQVEKRLLELLND